MEGIMKRFLGINVHICKYIAIEEEGGRYIFPHDFYPQNSNIFIYFSL